MSDFHDLFKQAVPEAPPTEGWVQGARTKRRNRQVAVSGVAALGIVALAVPLVLNLPGGGEDIVAAPAPSLTGPTPADTPPASDLALDPAPDGRVGAAACWDSAGEPVMGAHNAGTIADGAVRAWLCTNPQHYGTGGPMEPLVTDLDGLVEALYAQPELTDTSARESAELYTVVFEYDDGRRLSFTGDVQDGTVLTDGERELQGSQGFYEREVEARWVEQRERLLRPSELYQVPQECPAVSYQQSLLPVGLNAIWGGYACAAEAGEATNVVELPASLAANVGAVALASAEPVEASRDGGERTLVLANAWGDRIQLRKAGERYEFRGEAGLMGWTPQPELAAELDALFER